MAARTRYVVHRGGAALWPENSLLAFRNAMALGAKLLELDVHLTADGEVAVIHDPTLERTTDGAGRVDAHTRAELEGVRLRGPDGALTAESVPTLDQVLDLAAPAGVALLIELKTPGPAVTYERIDGVVTPVPGARYPELEQKVLARIVAAEVSDRAMLMAFNPAVVAEIRRLAPRQPTALLVEPDPRDGVRRRGVDAVDWATRAGVTFLGLHRELCDAAVVAAARAKGIGVGVFTVNDEAEMRRLAALGVDVVITDRADLARRLEADAE